MFGVLNETMLFTFCTKLNYNKFEIKIKLRIVLVIQSNIHVKIHFNTFVQKKTYKILQKKVGIVK